MVQSPAKNLSISDNTDQQEISAENAEVININKVKLNKLQRTIKKLTEQLKEEISVALVPDLRECRQMCEDITVLAGELNGRLKQK